MPWMPKAESAPAIVLHCLEAAAGARAEACRRTGATAGTGHGAARARRRPGKSQLVLQDISYCSPVPERPSGK